MPATNYTPIQFYRSTTSGNQPSAANLSPGELALNIADTDMTMYFENASGVVKRFFNNPAELKYPTADGTSGQGVKTDGSKTLSFGALASAAITNNTRQAVTSSATTTINLASGQVIDLTMAANITTLSFTNVPASGTPVLVQIVVRNASSGTAYTIAWPNSVYWSGQYSATTINTVQTAPTLASGANGVTTIALLTTDGGTKWRGWVESLIPGGPNYSLYAWGRNTGSDLGLGNNSINRSSPVQVGSLTNWAQVVTANTGLGVNSVISIKTDGTLWGWGSNRYGTLGLNSVSTYTFSPVQIGTLTNWATAAISNQVTLAVKTDGTLWAWGKNDVGQLGHSDTVSRSSPVQVGAGTSWSKVSTALAPNGLYGSSVAIKTDGTLWSWGGNNYGQLGLNGPLSNQSSPVQVGALTTWSKLSEGSPYKSVFAIKTDGTLWAWGIGRKGGLGLGDNESRSSPVQVGALTTWSKLSSNNANGSNLSVALQTNGTIWTWGYNSFGSLGLNNGTSPSSPTQIGALTTWTNVATNFRGGSAIKTDGTLWIWGENLYGQLGNSTSGNYTQVSSPIQLGVLTNWVSAAGGGQKIFALSGTVVNPA